MTGYFLCNSCHHRWQTNGGSFETKCPRCESRDVKFEIRSFGAPEWFHDEATETKPSD